MSNQYPSKPEVSGSVQISEHVIRSIAEEAALEVEGVESLAPVRSNPLRRSYAVSVSSANDFVVITLSLIFKSGYSLPKTAEQIQLAVKKNVQSMTGVVVGKVHIKAAGLVFEN